MESGGGFFGFHVSAFNTDPSTWDWYHNQFLGTGAFVSNTWGPTTAVLEVETRTRFVIDGLPWLGGGAATNAPADPISPYAWFTIVDKDGKRVDARVAATGNGTVIQQYTCNGTNAQEFQLRNVGGPYLKIVNRNDATKGLDVTNVSTADGAPIRLCSHVGGANQQWQAVPEGGRYYHLVNRNGDGTQCLTVPGSSTAGSVRLGQQSRTGIAAQSFHLVAQP